MYGLYFGLLYPLVTDKYKDNAEKLQEAVLALTKIINLDTKIAMEAYIDAYHQKLEFSNKELERLNWQLEDIVEERTEQLKEFEHKLRQVERLALIGTVASGIAHEVGTPLNIISGRVEMLVNKAGTDERLQKDLNIINQQIERITKIIRELLSVSRPREHAVTDIDVNELLTGVLQFLSVPIEKSRIHVSLNVDGCGSVVHGDKDQLQQVFLNLIVNALQSIEGSGKIDIRAACVDRDGSNYVCVEIADTGKGIARENLEKIFDPFFSTKSHGEGTGLGLPIVRDIVKKHDGYISVESEIGKGSTFSVLLPSPAAVAGKEDGS
jgi:signal transduction histidine kinase